MRDKIKKITEEFFNQMGSAVLINISEKEGDVFLINIKSDEPKVLIGQGGQTLLEIQHLLRIIVRKKTAELVNIDVDINDYKKKKSEYLKETARNAADEVFLSKTEKELPPMSSYERRIIHTELSNRSDVFTESFGQGEERRIIVKPKSPA